jgi:hypothetical protein
MPIQLNFTPANMLGYARKYSFYPPDQAEGYVAQGQTDLTGRFAGFRHTLVNDAQKVVRLSVKRQTDQMRNRGADFLVEPSLTATAGDYAYFLPWDARGAAVEMTIPRFNVGDDATANPPIFFTAVLSGCSIMFKGTPAKPTIFHCGTAGGGAGADTAGDSNQFFRSMIRNIKGLGLGRSNYNTGAQVLSTDYMTTRAGGGVAPGHETAFKNKLATHYDKQLVIENVNMWGCIFGFRTGTQWEFYLQENATISYRKVEDIVRHFVAEAIAQRRPGAFDFSTLTPQQLNAARIPQILRARPAVVTRVFPGGAAIANVTSRWKTLRT